MWDYAEMTHDAKEAGGPEAYVDAIEKHGMIKGIIIGVCGSAVGAVGFYGGKKAVKWASKILDNVPFLRKSKSKSDQAKKELIKGINEFDNSHQDDEADN